MQKILKLGLIILAISLTGVLAGCLKKKPAQVIPQISLEVWGVFDDSDVYSEINTIFAKNNPAVYRVKYKKIANNITDFEKQIIEAMANGTAPDIIYFKSSWLPKHGDKIIPEPDSQNDLLNFKNTFVDVVYDDFIYKNQIYAKPLYCDTLALYYNNDLLNQAGIVGPPKTWGELQKNIKTLTKIDDYGNIKQATIALGRAKDPGAVNRAGDIVMLMMMQGGAVMNENEKLYADLKNSKLSETSNIGAEVLKFYTSFANGNSPHYTWNARQDYSVDSFRYGRTAMMINYSYWYDRLKRSDPKLDFSIAPVPQTSLENQAVAYPSYWGLAVVKNKGVPQGANYTNNDRLKVAWEYINFITESTKQNNGYNATAQYLQETHKPPARRDLVEVMKNDLVIGPFAQQALIAKSWRQVDNGAIDKIFEDMIDAVNQGAINYDEAIKTAEERINVLVRDKK